jgi:hypothetical protein
MREEMSEEMNVFSENGRKTCDLFSRKTSGKHVICFPGKHPENISRVFQEYIQRKRQHVSQGNNWHKVKCFLFVSLENNERNSLPFLDVNR